VVKPRTYPPFDGGGRGNGATGGGAAAARGR
jgi:hypothetical protein